MAKHNLLTLIEADVPLKKVANTHGGEYAGPCPYCGGNDRFHVWPNEGKLGRYKCLGDKEGRAGCGRSGDAIQYLRDYHGLSYQAACEWLGLDNHYSFRLQANREGHIRTPPTQKLKDQLLEQSNPPNREWQTAAWSFAQACIDHLHATEGTKALAWLSQRGLALETIRRANLGYNPVDCYQDYSLWGLRSALSQYNRPNAVWLPRGVVIPWIFDNQLWRLNIRRPTGTPKYVGPAGWQPALYLCPNQDGAKSTVINRKQPIVLVEGEFDALTIYQYAGDLVTAVATGSTSGARQLRWITWLAVAPLVLLAYDADEPGEKAAAYWLDVLPNAKRWRPFWQDPNMMAQEGVDLRAWLEVGLGSH